MSATSLNKNNSAVKRIMQEARELASDPCTDYSAAPLEDDIFEWHCTLRGTSGTEFEGGLYHFRILLPAEYPFRPPSIMMLTPNGRFELNTKICISFTSYHEEMWQPAWGVRTAILGLQGFFPLKGQAAVGVGSIEYPTSERKRLAVLSREWVCPHCHESNLELLPDPASGNAHSTSPVSVQNASQPSADHPVPSPDHLPVSSMPQPPDSKAHLATASNAGLSLNAPPTDNSVLSPYTPTATSHINSAPVSFTRRAPLLLDTTICVLLVLVCALICRRLV
jgi:ubiquitin-conjugating enzyme E2 J1